MKKINRIVISIFIIVMIFTNYVFAIENSYSDIEIIDIFTKNDIVNILKTGESEFVEIYAKFNNGKIQNITNLVNWKSENAEIAYVYNNNDGRILAIDVGSTYVNISYLNFNKRIKINVIQQSNYKANINNIDISNNPTLTRENYLRNQVAAKAKAMIDISWIPKSNLTGWENLKVFKKDTKYNGIPYSQTVNQVDEIDFLSSMSFSDFYISLNNNYGGVMPRYGNDCSGFLSIAWGITRRNTTYFRNGISNGTYKKVGSYSTDNPTSAQLKTSYKFLKKGDAVVCVGHTFMIYNNDVVNSKVTAYEQTPPNAQITTWTYEQLANNKYLPFTLNYMDNGDIPNRFIDKNTKN